jgi:hypothetical protein
MRSAPPALTSNRTAAAAAVLLSVVLAVPAFAQAPATPQGRQGGARQGRQGGQGQGAQQGQTTGSLRQPRQQKPSAPTPRNAAGRAFVGTTTTDKGVWTPVFGITIPLAPRLDAGPDAAEASIPFQPWAKALYDARKDYQFEPHTRCKPSGFARQFITPYGVEFVELPELDRMYIFDIGGPHTYRTIYMDGRPHPEHLEPSYYGHSIGWWDGDTLVVDTVGYNDSFWMDRRGVPHTDKLHTIERFTRTNHDTMSYEMTIDDPGAFTKPWNSKFNLRWENGTELYEYVCQEDNVAAEDMASEFKIEDKVNPPIVP